MRTDRRCAAVTGAVVAAALVVGGGGVLWAALERAARDCPLVVPLGQDIRAEVVAVSFPDEVQGVGGRRMRVGDDRREKFRLGLVTIKITKPAGAALTLAAADVTLHYYHGDHAEVAPCEGLSTFSMTNDAERPMELSESDGPGFLKQSTGARATAADVLYVDAVFYGMEPDSNECWICIAQPVQRGGFRSGGWRR